MFCPPHSRPLRWVQIQHAKVDVQRKEKDEKRQWPPLTNSVTENCPDPRLQWLYSRSCLIWRRLAQWHLARVWYDVLEKKNRCQREVFPCLPAERIGLGPGERIGQSAGEHRIVWGSRFWRAATFRSELNLIVKSKRRIISKVQFHLSTILELITQ